MRRRVSGHRRPVILTFVCVCLKLPVTLKRASKSARAWWIMSRNGCGVVLVTQLCFGISAIIVFPSSSFNSAERRLVILAEG